MRSVKVAADAPAASDPDDIFFLTNLSPRMTGLPMTVWVSPCGNNTRHNVRIKINMAHGTQVSMDNMAIVAAGPVPRVIAGSLSSDDQHAVFAWIKENINAIDGYWYGRIDTAELVGKIKKIRPISAHTY